MHRQRRRKAPAKDLVLKGDAKCTSCHDEADEPKVLHIGKTKHGTLADGRTPSCTNCHGESDLHTYNPQKLKDRPATDRNFGKTSRLTAEEKSAACTTCHQGGKHMNWNTSAHANRDVGCTSCHQVHAGKDKVRDKRPAEVCYTCHKQQRAEASKPSHHPIPEGKMTCSDCHNAHGSAGPKMLVKDTTNATCYTCHAEKRGPFVHNHQPVVEDCGNCHNPTAPRLKPCSRPASPSSASSAMPMPPTRATCRASAPTCPTPSAATSVRAMPRPAAAPTATPMCMAATARAMRRPADPSASSADRGEGS
jgi:DmsE family decaheme c-type cytochrome